MLLLSQCFQVVMDLKFVVPYIHKTIVNMCIIVFVSTTQLAADRSYCFIFFYLVVFNTLYLKAELL